MPKGGLRLTAAGRDIANRLLHRHHLIERMLTEVFGMDWYRVHDEAEQLEHAVSEEFERLLMDKLGPGPACPHGNLVEMDTPADRRKRGWRTLFEIEKPAKVVSVFERDRALLEYLNGLGIRPGVVVTMKSRNYDDTLTLEVGERQVQLGRSAAEKIWVAYTATATPRKYSMVKRRPSSKPTFGSHPSSDFALVISGRRCRGSSCGRGFNSISRLVPINF